MPSSQVSLAQHDFASGMIRDVSPALIDDRGVYDIRNCVLTDDGALMRRGGTADVTTSDFGTGGLTSIWSGQMGPGQRTLVANGSDFGVRSGTSTVNLGSDGLSLPRRAAYVGGCLFIGGGYIYAGSLKSAPYSTGTVSVTNGSKTVTGSGTTWNTLVDAGMLLQLGNGRVYPVASINSTTSLTLRDAYEGSTASGQSYTLHNIYKITAADPYEAATHYAAVENRLVWNDGERIRFSKTILDGGPHTYSATEDWHELPDGSLVTGIAPIGNLTLIFTTAGIWTLRGAAYEIVSQTSGAPQQQMDKLSGDLVLFGDAGISYWEQLVIAPCLSGVFLLDGVGPPIKLSQNIEPLYVSYTDGPYAPGNAAVYKGHYFLPIVSSTATVQETLVCRLDRSALDRRRKSSFPWTRFDGHGGELRGYSVEVNSSGEPRLLGADPRGRIVNASAFLKPDDDLVTDADGTTPTWEVVTRDYTVDGMTRTLFRYLKLLYELSNGEIAADYGDGTRIVGTPEWGEVTWGAFTWADADEAEFHVLTRGGYPDTATADAGRTPHRWRVGQAGRRMRFRLRSEDPALCTLRSLEVLTRPPATRRR